MKGFEALETTIMGYIGYMRCHIIIGIQKGTIILTTTHILGLYWEYMGIMEKKMETTI